jgi:HK97 family phage portal protein
MVRGWRGFGPGEAIDTDQGMRLSAVFACLRLLSEAISTMPLDTFYRSNGARLPYRPKPEYLAFQPPQHSRIEYLSQVMLSLLTAGDAFVATPRDDLGVPLTLIPIDPCKVTVKRDARGEFYYRVGESDYSELDIMHIKGMTLPGAMTGLSPLAFAAETVDLGLSAQRYGAAFFANGAVPGAVIEAPNDFAQPAAERFAAMWNSRHQGVSNAARVGVLVNGAKLNKVSINPDEAQFLETRQFQVPDIARFFGVPPHLIADASNSTSWGSGLAEQNLAFGQFSLRPWVDRIEDAHGRLLTTHGLPQVFVKLNMDALLRSGTKERYDAHAVALENGFMTIDEVRRLEDLPPLGPNTPTPPAPAPPTMPPMQAAPPKGTP